jgi:DtxR family Mn-dependent transcriptional regulator
MKNKQSLLSSAMEDYLKAIYQLHAANGTVATTALAGALAVSAASVTNMIKKLAEMKLVRHVRYHGVELTPAGEKIALEVVRHHRLIELFLNETLGIPWDEVHTEAHRLEHVLSDNLEDHIAAFLGNPTEDPHGDPIPTKTGVVTSDARVCLIDLQPGTRATIRRITDQDPAHLRYLRLLGLVPKATVEIIEMAPFEGPVRVRVASREHTLDRQLAQHIRVSLARGARTGTPY